MNISQNTHIGPMANNPGAPPPMSAEDVRQHVLSQLDDNTLRTLCIRDSEVFFSVCMAETFNRPSANFHRFLVNVATRDQMSGRRICAVGPRGWGKSTTITEGGPLFICARNDHIPVAQRYMFILIVSETAAQAQARLAVIKDNLVNNERLAELFPDMAGEGPVWRQEMIVTNNNICIATAGMTTSIRGIRYKNRRPDLILLDDPDSIDSAASPTESAKLEARFTRDLLKCGHKRTDVLVAATIISKQCIAYKLLYGDEYSAWDGKVFKALEHFPTRMDLWDRWGELLKDRSDKQREATAEAFWLANMEAMLEGGVSNWPEEYPVKTLMREYYVEGRKAFLTEKQNEVIESDLAHFAPERYRYFTEAEWAVAKQVHPLIYMYIDPSEGKASTQSAYTSRGPDRFAVALLAKVADDRLMFIDGVAAQMRQSLQFEQIANLLVRHNVFKMSCEANAGQSYYVNALRAYLAEQFADPEWRARAATRNLIIPRPVINTVAKEKRIASLEPYLDNHTLELPANMAKRFRPFMDELECWPTSPFDDCLDALAGCFFSAFRTYRFSHLTYGD